MEWTAGARCSVRKKDISFQRLPIDFRAHLASYPAFPGALSPGVKRQGPEADQSPPTSAGGDNVDLYIHSPIRLYGVELS
jgi:hypothetical protein